MEMFADFKSRPAAQAIRCRCRSGHAVIEVALLAPWMLLLFAAIYDFGAYVNAFISVENAARAAALRTSIGPDSADDVELACSVVRAQMKTAWNSSKMASPCDKLPLRVTAQAATDTEGFTTTRVSVSYQTPQLFKLPYMPGQLTLTRTAEMRVKP